MLKENSSIDFISKVTGLSKEEIENIKEEQIWFIKFDMVGRLNLPTIFVHKK